MVSVSMRMNPYRCCPIIPRLCTLGSNCEMDDSERRKDRIGESSHPPPKSVLGGLETARVELPMKANMEVIETGSGSVESPGTRVSVGAPVPVLESHDERTTIKG